ncbi:MAG: Regulator of RpoS [Candidatus Heimdallarchaeota archaeon LC_3]|nr:MAG: Regulator of RpoS [Candidatus Heimdallarchaeota archaeon LC_3]
MQSVSTSRINDSMYEDSKSNTKRKILIVDDNEDQLVMYKFLFTSFNNKYDYLTFSSPEEAMNYMNKLKNKKYRNILNELDNINLIISDYNMFPKNGLEFFKELNNQGIVIPFVLFSSFISNAIVSEAKSLGIVECIEKDINIQNTIDKLGFYLI